jgi:hypothetical protein
MNNGDTVAKKGITSSFKRKKRQQKFGMKGKRMY